MVSCSTSSRSGCEKLPDVLLKKEFEDVGREVAVEASKTSARLGRSIVVLLVVFELVDFIQIEVRDVVVDQVGEIGRRRTREKFW